MSKDKWISVALDGSVDDEQIKMLLEMSYELTEMKIQRKRKTKHEQKESQTEKTDRP